LPSMSAASACIPSSGCFFSAYHLQTEREKEREREGGWGVGWGGG
jgi:hypothetical protein